MLRNASIGLYVETRRYIYSNRCKFKVPTLRGWTDDAGRTNTADTTRNNNYVRSHGPHIGVTPRHPIRYTCASMRQHEITPCAYYTEMYEDVLARYICKTNASGAHTPHKVYVTQNRSVFTIPSIATTKLVWVCAHYYYCALDILKVSTERASARIVRCMWAYTLHFSSVWRRVCTNIMRAAWTWEYAWARYLEEAIAGGVVRGHTNIFWVYCTRSLYCWNARSLQVWWCVCVCAFLYRSAECCKLHCIRHAPAINIYGELLNVRCGNWYVYIYIYRSFERIRAISLIRINIVPVWVHLVNFHFRMCSV